jgi:basic amino acid/polyamine antiporter, APA family
MSPLSNANITPPRSSRGPIPGHGTTVAYSDDLPRKLGSFDAALIIIGIVIGSGIFLLPNLIARELPSTGAIIAVWVVAGLLSYLGALAYAELGAMMPATGGHYVYLREAYGPLCAFVCGWTFMLVVLSGGIAWLGVSFSVYVGQFVHLSSLAAKLIALLLIALLSAVNCLGVKEGIWVQRIFTSLKIAGLLLLIGAGLLSRASVAPATSGVHPLLFNQFGLAMIACLMAYNGWTYVSFVAGEIKQPERNIPRALTLSMFMVIALYVFANVAYMRVLSLPEIAATERVGAALAGRTMGSIGATILSATVLLSIIGAINGCIMTAARVPFAQARDGSFFAQFGRIHPKFQTPAYATVAQGVWAAVLVLTGSYETLFSYSMVAAWIFYTLSVGAVFLLRRSQPDRPRPYRMWGYPYTLWLFILVSVWFIANAFVTQLVPSLMALVIILTGLPAYLLFRRSPKTRVTVSSGIK